MMHLLVKPAQATKAPEAFTQVERGTYRLAVFAPER